MLLMLKVVSCVFLLRIVLYFYHLILSYRYIKCDIKTKRIEQQVSMLILIPVLREQKVICDTLQHFVNMNLDNSKLYLMIAGTNRESLVEEDTTLEVVQKWIDEYKKLLPKNIIVDYSEAFDEGGDRATQLNYAVSYIREKRNVVDLEYIGVYDADSLPSCETIREVITVFNEDKNLCACQQPVHFVLAANKMNEKKENPILIANALYQSTWTIINELPMWIKYYRNKKKRSLRHIYLIGHGEFLSKKTYEEFQFPEYEITDGIQLGYRLGMSGKKVKPLKEFCNDDVPHDIGSLIKQHKRWYGGCMNLLSAHKWSRQYYGIGAKVQVIDGLWSQFRWAFTSWIYSILLILSLYIDVKFFVFLVFLGLIYCYLIPIIAHCILPSKIKVSVFAWLCLPLAIFIKSIGPNVFLWNKLFGKKIHYEKVER